MSFTYSRDDLHQLLGDPALSRTAAVHEPGGAVRFSVQDRSLESGEGRPLEELRYACGCRAVQEAPDDPQFILYPCASHRSSGTFERLRATDDIRPDPASGVRLADL